MKVEPCKDVWLIIHRQLHLYAKTLAQLKHENSTDLRFQFIVIRDG